MANPDRDLIDAFLRGSGAPIAFDSNPMGRALNAHIVAVDAQNGAVTLSFEPGADFVQGGGVIQGGIVAMMLDFALALSAMTKLPPGFAVATLSLNVSYLRAARPGVLRATGRLDRATKRAAFTQARIEGADGEAIATAMSVLALIEDRTASS